MSAVPPSRRIADDLRRQISEGQLAAGDKLPSERVLADQHGAARNTARQAIAILQAEGLVDAEHGRGVFVRSTRRLLRLASDRYGREQRTAGRGPFRAEVERQGGTARVDVAAIDAIDPPNDVARRLDSDGRVVCRVNHYYADDRLVQVVTTYIPLAIAEGTPLTDAEVGEGGIYDRLADAGHELTAFTEDITSRMPTPDEAELLATAPGVPVLEVIHTSRDQHGEPFEVTRFVLPADRHTLSYTLTVE